MAIPFMNVINLFSHSCSASIDILTMVQVKTSKDKCHEEEFHSYAIAGAVDRDQPLPD